MNVWNSRPIDVHRMSDHLQAKAAIDKLWGEFCQEYPTYSKAKRGRQPLGSIKDHFKVVILDLYVCWLEDPSRCLGVHLNPNAYTGVNSSYNKLHISKSLIDVVKKLDSIKWIKLNKGSYSRTPGIGRNRTSRIQASPFLITRFDDFGFSLNLLPTYLGRECLILKDGIVDIGSDGEEKSNSVPIEYQDTPHTIGIRSILQKYNELLQSTHIDICDLDTPILQREIQSKNGKVDTYKVSVAQHNKFIRRIFSEGSWQKHGRMYGGFWQQIDEVSRSKIFIDHHDTLEVDFKALHLNLLYAYFVGEPLIHSKDPYILECFSDSKETTDVLRNRVKKLMLPLINAKSRKSAFKAYRNSAPKGSPDKRLTDNQLGELLDNFIYEHPLLEPFLCKGMGNDLMYLDGEITFEIIKQLTEQQIPVLTIHDSYIVKSNNFVDLRTAMSSASLRITGTDLVAVQEQFNTKPNIPFSFYEENYLNSACNFYICDSYETRYKEWKNDLDFTSH